MWLPVRPIRPEPSGALAAPRQFADLRPLDRVSSGRRGLLYDLAELLSLGVFVAGLCCVAKALVS